jgi:PA14 domain/Divergent InlB B-repeat domain/Fibronectin type III domain
MPSVPPFPVNYSNLDVRFGRFFWVITLFLISSHAHVRAAQNVKLAWNASPSSGVTGYRLHYRQSSGGQTTSVDVGNVLTATISNLNDATTYLCSVSAYNSAGLESARSNEISYTTPSSAPGSYTLTVNNGTGDGTYPVGREVTVTANSPPPGQEFDDWEDDTMILDDFTRASTQALIIARDLTITATYKPLPTFNVTVTNGTGDGSYYAGAQVNITAASPPAGQQFAGWTGNVTFANASSPNTSFTMPSSPVVVTATYSVSSGSTGTGLRAQYYNDPSNGAYPLADPFTGSPVLTRTDGTVDFNWGNGSPASQVNSDSFSARWTGQVKAPVSGSYTFTVTGDDGVSLFINGTRVINGWRDQDTTVYSYTTTLSAGTLYDIELHYYEYGGDAECRLRWSYPGQSTQTIPSSQLYPSIGP